MSRCGSIYACWKQSSVEPESRCLSLACGIEGLARNQDLLLSQQLANMWVLPLHEEGKRETCLSGFEKLAHEVGAHDLLYVVFKLLGTKQGLLG